MTDRAVAIYHQLPIPLQHALISAYGARLRYLRYGPAASRFLAQIMESQHWSAERWQAYQLEQLNGMIRHAATTVPVYRERGLGEQPVRDLGELLQRPMIRKADLQTTREQVVSSDYAGKKLAEVHTGGTTGTPLSIYCDRAALGKNFAFLARFRAQVGAPIFQRAAVFAGRTLVAPGVESPPFWRRNLATNTMLFSSYHISPRTIPSYVDALRRFKPVLIDSYPSSLLPVARYMVDQGISDIRPRAIITSSETLDPEPRAVMQQAFGCRVHDCYGHAEMAALFTECTHGRYHDNPDYGAVEIVAGDRHAAPGEIGDVVATGFVNPVMPLIRYATGDLAVRGTGGCACGSAFPVIERVEGRRDEVLVTPEGRLIGRLDPIFKAIHSVFESQIVQDRADHVRVDVVARDDFSPEEEHTLKHGLALRLGPSMTIDVVRVPRIARTRSGKLRSVVNLVHNTRRDGDDDER